MNAEYVIIQFLIIGLIIFLTVTIMDVPGYLYDMYLRLLKHPQKTLYSMFEVVNSRKLRSC